MVKRADFDPLLTFAEVLDHLRIGEDLLRSAIQSGELVAINVGRGAVPRWRIAPADLEAFKIARRAVRETPSPTPKFRRPPGLKRWT